MWCLISTGDHTKYHVLNYAALNPIQRIQAANNIGALKPHGSHHTLTQLRSLRQLLGNFTASLILWRQAGGCSHKSLWCLANKLA